MRPLTFNIEGATKTGSIRFQAALDTRHFYDLLKKYFETEVLVSIRDGSFNAQKLQDALNEKAAKVPSLNAYTFDSDQRVGELAVLMGLLETLFRRQMIAEDRFTYLPAWQLPGQKQAVEQHFKKESFDGYLACLPKQTSPSSQMIALPLEVKSLMAHPNKATTGNPNDQLKERVAKFGPLFKKNPGINCVLVMPYSNEQKLELDLKTAAEDLHSYRNSGGLTVVCMLSFPNLLKDVTTMSLYYFITGDTTALTIEEANKRVWEVNFGRLSLQEVSKTS